MLELKNQIKEYSWGDKTSISTFIKEVNINLSPQAEMWIGTHKDGCSLIKDTNEFLSKKTNLNFLVKLLAAESPLSIQVHPNLKEAQRGYNRGLTDTRLSQTYKDSNHKPEMIISLSNEFTGLVGFKTHNEIKTLIKTLSASITNENDLQKLNELIYSDSISLMKIINNIFVDKNFSDYMLPILKKAIISSSISDSSEEIKNLKFILEYYNNDSGLILALFMKFYKIKKGEALYIPPKTIHAYMQGFGIEVMASSDNVIRCGLTKKFIDVDEMVNIVSPVLGGSHITKPISNKQYQLWSPCNDFKVKLTNENGTFTIDKNSIILIADENCLVNDKHVKRGSTYFVEETTKLSLSKNIYIIS